MVFYMFGVMQFEIYKRINLDWNLTILVYFPNANLIHNYSDPFYQKFTQYRSHTKSFNHYWVSDMSETHRPHAGPIFHLPGRWTLWTFFLWDGLRNTILSQFHWKRARDDEDTSFSILNALICRAQTKSCKSNEKLDVLLFLVEQTQRAESSKKLVDKLDVLLRTKSRCWHSGLNSGDVFLLSRVYKRGCPLSVCCPLLPLLLHTPSADGGGALLLLLSLL